MRNYIGELRFNKNKSIAMLEENIKSQFFNQSIGQNFDFFKNISTTDFKIIELERFCLIIDGEIYDNNYNVNINDSTFLNDIVSNFEKGDTEIIRNLNGSFNFIIYNYLTEKLTIINDRFATRPLYYYKDNNRFIFSNKMTLIPQFYTSNQWEINYNSVREFFKLQMVFGPSTYLENVFSLENATYNIINNNIIESEKYWKFNHQIDHENKHIDYISSFSNIMEKIIDYKTKEDKSFGIFMSGGMDSRAILAADKKKRISNVFTIGDSFNRECQIAKNVSDKHNANFHYIERNNNFYEEIIDESVLVGDGMYNYLNGHFFKHVDYVIDSKIDIVFNGALVEQLWQGTKFIKKRIKLFGKSIVLPWVLTNEVGDLETIKVNLPRVVGQADRIFKDSHLTEEIINVSLKRKLAENFDKNNFTNQEAIDYLACDANGKYSSHLNQLSINEKVPYRTAYDNNLIDAILKMPIQLRASGNLLRKSIDNLNSDLSNIKVADTNILLKNNHLLHWSKSMMDKTSNRLKKKTRIQDNHSSWPNYAKLIIESEEIQKRIEEVIFNTDILNIEIFNKDEIEVLYNQHLNGTKNNERILFLLLTFGEWYKTIRPYLDK